jgi:hypothetical protein
VADRSGSAIEDTTAGTPTTAITATASELEKAEKSEKAVLLFEERTAFSGFIREFRGQ